ncbi:MAG: DUF2442 domain-containing protein [Ardenticatenaceae bacterium]|nr:DUF2442 domain-containing protein [Ardenticatenaceae bacterium]
MPKLIKRLSEKPVISVEQVIYDGDYRIRLFFNNGVEQTVDFAPFFMASNHPQIRKYLDLQRFQHFTVEYGDLLWGDYDLCFPIADLYDNNI